METLSRTDDRRRERDGYLPSFARLKEWLRQDGDSLHQSRVPELGVLGERFSDRRLRVTETADAWVGRPLVCNVSSGGGAFTVIAFGGSPIHPLLWRVGVIVEEASVTEAVLADCIQS